MASNIFPKIIGQERILIANHDSNTCKQLPSFSKEVASSEMYHSSSSISGFAQ
jgi:hypothetical protein